MKEINTKNKVDLIKEMRECKKALRENRFRSSPDEKNTKIRRETRKNIARMATALNINATKK